MKFHGAAPNSLATGAFQKRNWSQIDPMVDRGLKSFSKVFGCRWRISNRKLGSHPQFCMVKCKY